MKVENEIQSPKGLIVQVPIRIKTREQDNRRRWGNRVVRNHGNTGPNEKKGCRQIAQGKQNDKQDGVSEEPPV